MGTPYIPFPRRKPDVLSVAYVVFVITAHRTTTFKMLSEAISNYPKYFSALAHGCVKYITLHQPEAMARYAQYGMDSSFTKSRLSFIYYCIRAKTDLHV